MVANEDLRELALQICTMRTQAYMSNHAPHVLFGYSLLRPDFTWPPGLTNDHASSSWHSLRHSSFVKIDEHRFPADVRSLLLQPIGPAPETMHLQ